MNNIYYGIFTCLEDVVREFSISEKELEGIAIIYADYFNADYSGEAHVIFVKDNQLYEINGSHCSCNGLEACWEPEVTSALALLNRPNVSAEAKANVKYLYRNLMCFL